MKNFVRILQEPFLNLNGISLKRNIFQLNCLPNRLPAAILEKALTMRRFLFLN